MSRYTATNERFHVAWGYDHAVGLFIQVFLLSGGEPEDEPLIDLDWGFDGLDLEDLLMVARQYQVLQPVEDTVPHLTKEMEGLYE